MTQSWGKEEATHHHASQHPPPFNALPQVLRVNRDLYHTGTLGVYFSYIPGVLGLLVMEVVVPASQKEAPAVSFSFLDSNDGFDDGYDYNLPENYKVLKGPTSDKELLENSTLEDLLDAIQYGRLKKVQRLLAVGHNINGVSHVRSMPTFVCAYVTAVETWALCFDACCCVWLR